MTNQFRFPFEKLEASRHTFEDDAARTTLGPDERITPSVRVCRGSIYRTRNDGRHKCRPYKDLKRKFLCYELSRLRREFFDRINKINKIFLYSLYLPAGRQAGPEHPVYPV